MSKDDFCEQIRLCEGAMYRLALSIVKNRCDAEDVLSEAVYLAYKNLDTLKNSRSFKPWILRIVHNAAVGLIRKNAPIVLTDTIPEENDENSENRLATSLTLRQAVESLKQPYRTVVVLFYYENIPAAKIAQITGARPAAVKQQLSRARKLLWEMLKEDFS